MQKDLTQGSVLKTLFRFSVPYLISCFLQTFYGMADLFIAGQFRGASTISAVSLGSQIMHMLTVVLVGMAMGTTVSISRAVGAKDNGRTAKSIGNSVVLFSCFAAILTVLLLCLSKNILRILQTPEEAFAEALRYIVICFAGIPFITAYNITSSIFRGLGDSARPMLFIFIAGVINIVLDYLFMGSFGMGAAGAALATVISQACSVCIALAFLHSSRGGVRLTRRDLRPDRSMMSELLHIGVPISCQDGLIQVSFLVITTIANSRGVLVAAGVGIVEKIISFLFLVPSAMLSSVSAIAAQNAGAGLHSRGRRTLFYAMGICLVFGSAVTILCQFFAEPILRMFASAEPEVIRLGSQYLRSYVFDCIAAGIHFCFSGYFCAYGKAGFSFIQNIASIILIRIPGAYLASVLFPDTLLPMGMAAPLGSALSSVICIVLFLAFRDCWGRDQKNPA